MSTASVVLEPTTPGSADISALARWRRNRWLRGLSALLAGVLTGLAWQPYGLWPLLLIGIPALTLLVRDASPARPRRSAFGVGYLYGLGMLGISISWIHVLGIWIAVLLIAFEALFFGLLGLTLHLTSALRWWPLAAALCWSLIEFLYARVPFGGFGWIRLAYAAVDTPLAGFLPVIGVAGVSFLVALVAQLVGVRGRRLCRPPAPPGHRRPPTAPVRRRRGRAGPARSRPAARPAGSRSDPGRPAGRHRAGQRARPGHRGPRPDAVGHQQPPQRDHQPDGRGSPGRHADAGLHPVAGELHRHRPHPRPGHRSHRAGRRRRSPTVPSWSAP